MLTAGAGRDTVLSPRLCTPSNRCCVLILATAANTLRQAYNMARKFMRNWRVFVRNAAIVTALSVSLSACVVYPARVAYAGPVVAVAPPAPIVETYGVAP